MNHTDFIAVYPDALEPAACAALIERFEHSQQATPGTVGGGLKPDLKDSSDITLNGREEWNDAINLLNQAVLKHLVAYFRIHAYALIAPLMLEYQDPGSDTRRRLRDSDLAEMNDLQLSQVLTTVFRPGDINLQRYTANRGGYPYWHCELFPMHGNCEQLHRHLLWTIYLNDNFLEGETEFFYQQRKIVPRTGSLLIAPTAFTHTHRGNMPKQADKYIATSWVLFQRAEQLFGKPPGTP
jgi:hypothetical protein